MRLAGIARRLVIVGAAALVAAAAVPAGPGQVPAALAQEGDEKEPAAPEDVPVSVAATLDVADLPTTGIFTIHLDFTADADVGRAYSVVVDLAYGDRVLLSWDHAPTPPPAKWKKGQKVRCDVQAPFPRDVADLEGCTLDILVGFRDADTSRVLPPRSALAVRNGKQEVAHLDAPRFEPVSGEEAVARMLAAAEALVAAGRKPEAWAALEFALRGAPDDLTKYRFRNAMAKLGDFAPQPLTEIERRIVEQRIADERRRYLRQASGRMFDQGKYHAALRILEEVGGKLAEAADAAVIGALRDAKRVEKDLQDLRERIWERVTDEDKADIEKAQKAHGRTRPLLDRAKDWIKSGRHAAARRVLKDLAVAGPKDVAGEAFALAKDVEKAMLAAIPPAEVADAQAALNHPVFARTTVSLSHEFVFIGPERLVSTIPQGSRTAFDLAYVFVTDLFGRRPNPEGDRVTVYFKELWDFGGGVGGGKIIDIGNARPDATNTSVDNHLLFHELVHCVDDTKPIHAGFREGLADFGATYAAEALGRTQDAQRGFASAATAFQKDYVSRDLEYWRIPNYGPSAGFFLHFSEKFAKASQGHDWKGWRQFFREYRDAPVRDGREPAVIRAFAHYLVRAFGPGAFDDLVTFRFPLEPSDRDALEREVDAFRSRGGPLPGEEGDYDSFPNSPIPRDLTARRALGAAQGGGGDDEARRISREELGVLHEWKVIGPFEPKGTDPGAQPFPPEHEIDFAKEYPQRMNIARWRTAGDPGPVQIDPVGWVKIEYGYMDDTATYAATHLTVDADTDVRFHLRADDDVSLFVGGERLDGYENRGWNDSTRLPWRGPIANVPDAIRFSARLRAGRNLVLVKIRNRAGGAGFACAVSLPNGKPVPSLRTDLGPPEPAAPAPKGGAKAEPKWHTAAKLDFRTKGGGGKLDVTAGGFESASKALSGTTTTKGVAWRKYTVRPGFAKDSPSNMAWLKSDVTAGVDDFRLTFRLVPGREPPKLAVTFQGEGGNDGLSGWNVLLWNSGGKIAGQVERYEDLWLQWPAAERAEKFGGKPADDGKGDGGKTRDRGKERDPDDTEDLVLTVVARRLTVTLGGVALLTEESIRPIPGRTRIGFSTWGADPKIAGMELETLK